MHINDGVTGRKQPNEDDVRTFTMAAEAGLWGQIVKALSHEEGGGAALALLGNVTISRGTVDCVVRFHQDGVSFDGACCLYGARSHLFSVYGPTGRDSEHIQADPHGLRRLWICVFWRWSSSCCEADPLWVVSSGEVST